MLPWTWAVAYRRFNQGVLIRFGHPVTVGKGTFVRLAADLLVLIVGYYIGSIPGIIVAASAVAVGVISEALYIGFKVKPVIESQLMSQDPVDPELSKPVFLKYYIPLALTSLITLLSQPLISSALSRMPRALDSLAVWPVLSGLLFMFRSLGIAYNEVVVTLLDKPGYYPKLRSFAILLSGITSVMLLLVIATPLSNFWLESISALPVPLVSLAQTALWFSLLLPGATALQSWYQGLLLNSGETGGIPEAVGVFLVITIAVYIIGMNQESIPGIYYGIVGFSLGMTGQVLWLKFRSRKARSLSSTPLAKIKE
jgi:hypothetical protein